MLTENQEFLEKQVCVNIHVHCDRETDNIAQKSAARIYLLVWEQD